MKGFLSLGFASFTNDFQGLIQFDIHRSQVFGQGKEFLADPNIGSETADIRLNLFTLFVLSKGSGKFEAFKGFFQSDFGQA